MPDKASRLSNVIDQMAKRRQAVTFADDGDHANPIVRFRLNKPRASIDEHNRVLIKDLKWEVESTTLKRRRVEEILELERFHYFGTPMATLAALYAQGRLQAAR